MYTKSLTSLYPYFKIFYEKNESGYTKVIPKCISELLTPQALAYWICDDGMYVKRGGITLCTDSYTESDVLFLKSVLETKFNFHCSIHYKKSRQPGSTIIYYRIYIFGKSLAHLRSLVEQYMHSSMMYKLSY